MVGTHRVWCTYSTKARRDSFWGGSPTDDELVSDLDEDDNSLGDSERESEYHFEFEQDLHLDIIYAGFVIKFKEDSIVYSDSSLQWF